MRATPLEDHPKGRQFTLVTEARVGGELVWEDFSTNLRRGKGSGDEKKRAAREEPPPPSADWTLDGGLGRRYAAVSGDRNPIHMHDLSAKLFGFPRAIVHGMWTKARVTGRAGGPAAGRVRGGRGVQEADPAAGEGDLRVRGRRHRHPLHGPFA